MANPSLAVGFQLWVSSIMNSGGIYGRFYNYLDTSNAQPTP